MAVIVPVVTRLMTLSLCIAPVRFAATVTPLAQVRVHGSGHRRSRLNCDQPLHIRAVD